MTVSATCRISVDLPAMLGPVTIRSCSAVGIEADVVRDEGAGGRQPLDDRVARRPSSSMTPPSSTSRPAVARTVRDLGERRQRVDARATRAASASSRADAAGHRRAQRRRRSPARARPAARRRRGSSASNSASSGVTKRSALATRLLAAVVGRHRREVRARDLDVVAEHAVELDLQRRDAGALALARLDGGDAAAPAGRDVAQLVELGARRRR